MTTLVGKASSGKACVTATPTPAETQRHHQRRVVGPRSHFLREVALAERVVEALAHDRLGPSEDQRLVGDVRRPELGAVREPVIGPQQAHGVRLEDRLDPQAAAAERHGGECDVEAAGAKLLELGHGARGPRSRP